MDETNGEPTTDEQKPTESTLIFTPDERYPNSPIYELVAEGIHERGERSVRAEYVLDTEVEDEPQLLEKRYYRIDGERRNQDSGISWSLSEDGDTFVVDDTGEALRDFVESSFHSDPDVEVGEAFDEMVNQ
jgi:hypothetical protein